MPYVNVPNDLSKIKTKIAFNLTKRQLICFGMGAAMGVPTYLLTRQAIGNTGALFAIISWADMYDSASMEAKKMIVSCLIRRVEVYRDYRLHIDFNIDFEQFSAGLDISAIAA